MEDHVAVLDSCDYEMENNGTCILRGWCCTGSREELQVQVRVEHVPIQCSITGVPRPDVVNARPDLDFQGEMPGFEIRIPNIEQITSLSGTLRVRLIFGSEGIPVLQKEMEQIRQEYYHATLRYHLEIVERRGENVYIQGWCINLCGKLTIKFLENNGKELEEVFLEEVRRADLPEQFQVPLSKCHGFSIKIPRKKITSRELRMVFVNPVTENEERISMVRFDCENTRVSRMFHVMEKENREKNREILKEAGIRGFWEYLLEESYSHADAYVYYAKKQRPKKRELARQTKEVFSPSWLFSIVVPLYQTPWEFLKILVDSMLAQSYQNWELCLADGSQNDAIGRFLKDQYGQEPRIRYEHLKENQGIAGNTNAALAMAKGDFIAFADHDDFLEPDALYLAAKTFQEYPKTELLYTDEELTDKQGHSRYPHFKPDFNLDYLRCLNYICHLVVVKKSLLDRVGTLRPEFDGAQDYDFLLRCTEQTKEIRHIPKVLYHWRSHEDSTAGNKENKTYAVEAGKRALEEHYKRLGIKAEVEFTGWFIVYRTKFEVQGNPMVSVLIPNKDHRKDLETCISSVLEKNTWKNLEILVIENNSTEPETFAFYKKLQKIYPQVRVVEYQGEFNYSAINNFGASCAKGDYLLLLNNDTEVIKEDWLERLIGYCQREETGIAGAKLFYPDNTVQHAGIVIGMGGFAGHIQTGYVKDYTGYMGRLVTAQKVSAVTGACLLVKRSVFDRLKGLDEEFAVALNDVDFCLRAEALGYDCVFVPEAELYHYESKSRGLETTPEKQARFRKEILRFQERYKKLLETGDPYYNPNLSLVQGDCSVRRAHETVKGKGNT